MNVFQAALQGHGPIHRLVAPPPRPFNVPVNALSDEYAASIRNQVMLGYINAIILEGVMWVSISSIQETLAYGECCYDEHSGCYIRNEIIFDHDAYETERAARAAGRL